MTLPNVRHQIARSMVVAAAVLAAGAMLAAQAQTPPAPAPASTVVAVTALTPLVPTPPGWTKLRDTSTHIELSPGADYSYADAVFLSEDLKVRLTVADTGKHAECLALLASIVMSFPDDYSAKVPPATTITRTRIAEWPASELWDKDKTKGEIAIVVDGRFVAKAEGTVDSLETLRNLVQLVDLKKLAALK